MSYLKKVEVVALKKKHTKKIKPKAAKADGDGTAKADTAAKAQAKKAAMAFLKFMEKFVGEQISADDFLDGMLAVWKGKSNTKALREDPSGSGMAKVYTNAEFPAVIKLLGDVKSKAQALTVSKLPKKDQKKASWEK